MLLVGLTGGIASGKSIALGMLAELGAIIFSADEAARAVLAPGSRVESEVAARFGEGILDAHGRVSRSKLAELVFGSHDLRKALNGILHPPIRRLLIAQIDSVRMDYPASSIVVVEVPLLFEGQMQNWFDSTVLIAASTQTQIERLVKTRRLSEDQARSRLSSQWSIELKASLADEIIVNDGSVFDLHQSIEALWGRLIALNRGALDASTRFV